MSNSIKPAARTVDFQIEGMTCASCVTRVEKAIRGLPGVASASVNLATERATIGSTGKPDTAEVLAAIAKAGYSVRQETLELQIEGMTCASCVARIEKSLVAVPGVVSASINLATEKAVIKYAAGASPRPLVPSSRHQVWMRQRQRQRCLFLLRS